MDFNTLDRYRPYIIIALLIVLALVTIWIRSLSVPMMVGEAGVDMLGNDPWYTMRQVEQTVAHFPGYAWFDAMTQYPNGETIYWGPLFVWIIAGLSLVTGAAARPELMVVGSWVPPLMAAAMVPVMYRLGERVLDWKTGILAAGLVVVVGGQYFYRSLFGFVDHHIAEVLFSTIFCLAYIEAIRATKGIPIDFHRFETLRRPVIHGAIAGVAYLLGLLAMPTMVLFAFIVAVFTVVQFVWDVSRDRSSDYLLLINTTTFGVAIITFLLFGIKHAGLSLSQYSIAHVYAYLAVIAGTALLWLVARYLRGRPKLLYPAVLAVLAVVGGGILYVALPGVYTAIIGSLAGFFGQQAVVFTVEEARGWSFAMAQQTFHWAWPLVLGGIAAIVLRNRQKEHPDQIFILVWSLVILFSTWQHLRYEYYLAANVVLLSAIFLGSIVEWCGPAAWETVTNLVRGRRKTPEPEPEKSKKKSKKHRKPVQPKRPSVGPSGGARTAVFFVSAAIALLFVSTAAANGVALSSSVYRHGMNPDWEEALSWMGENTPETGVDYYAIYERDSFTYPDESYGVMTWWDYGHWITFISKRIPNANPFQRGVTGETGSASYFLSQSEDRANGILDQLGTDYVITDFEMDTGKFWAMATWFNDSVGKSPYQPTYLMQEEGSDSYQTVSLNTQDYYRTMVSRLHNFDGSRAEPSQAIYLEYMTTAAVRDQFPGLDPAQYNGIITAAQAMDPETALARARAFNADAPSGRRAIAVNTALTSPVEPVPALLHYRLVHESPTDVYGGQSGWPDLRYVKVFEYVPGARIEGEGTIEVPLVTNQGRTFTYSQQSTGGEFVVPYATTGTVDGVRATGPYTIVETGRTIEVSEDAVRQGLTVG